MHYSLQQVDCDWGAWQPGICSKECGGGIQIYTREKIPEHLFGGKECEGEAVVEKECNTQSCPSKEKLLTLIK